MHHHLYACSRVYYFVSFFFGTSLKKQKQGFKNIPIPNGKVPYFGHLFALMRSSITVQTAQWQKELGSIMKIYVGVQPWIVVGDPYLAHEILAVNGSIASNRPYTTFSHDIYAPNQRVLHMVSSKTTADERYRMQEMEADALIERLLQHTESVNGDKEINILPHFQLVFANVIFTMMYGCQRMTSIDDPMFKRIEAIMAEGLANVNIMKELKVFLSIFSFIDYLFSHATMKWVVQDLANPLYLSLIKDALENGDPHCLVNQLKQMDHVDYDEILVTVSDLAIAGTDTPAIETMWTILILCCYQEAQQVLHDKVDTFISKHNRLPTFNDREKLPNLISTQKECMRFRPPVFYGLLHETSRDRSIIASNMRAMHMNSDIYEESEKFCQDRFINKSNKTMSALANGKIQERDQYTYGWGRRLCPGAHLAEVQIFSILVRLVAKLKIEPRIDPQGNLVFPDLDKLHEAGVMVIPTDRNVCITKRTDSLL
ncbi:cytochrome P450 [Phascolomyces articulosus]|uniref:Cytochrome P450 n=1 Tax=Phascolomyces articulosus TaxID=60185 RepID=A0AAD5JTK6_9FUNG|nr:cytochrome P450 [Phascolomyces articulosus]